MAKSCMTQLEYAMKEYSRCCKYCDSMFIGTRSSKVCPKCKEENWNKRIENKLW